MQSSARTSDATCSRGVFNFMAADTPPSLFRNGQVLIHRRPDGGTSHAQGFDLEAHTLEVRNARLLPAADQRSCEMNGFELIDCPLDDETLDFMDHQEIVRGYYHQCSRLVSAVTGAPAYAFDHNVRSASGQQADARIRGGQGVQPPAHLVHGDYTLRGAPERLQQLTRPPSGNDTYRDLLPPGEALISSADAERALAGNGRFAIINVWRNIASEPVATHPLALCDGRTVEPDDLVVFEIHYPDRIGENYFARYAPRQTMYFYPRMARDEALLIKQWDSAGSLARSNGSQGDGASEQAPCTFSFHSAFDDPDTPPDAPDRWSIEVRCMVIYD